ncbi:MAG TPA: sulfite exporter TauE/SafE family protein, partial [Verrucomicrobiae bacterium]|nr:sulfite exporter TauE/SafE family protein [Verrucomicrobiae bacterium]
MEPHAPIWIAALAVTFIGVSKAGFGGGLGILTTPLCVLAFGSKNAIGILLPLLCAGDAFSLYHYWRKWESANLKYLLPGVVAGVIVGVQLIGHASPRQLNMAIGVLAVSFVLFQLAKNAIFRAEGAFAPNHKIGIPCGIGAGITSAVAHGAGPLVAVFLIPQRLPKEVYVGTSVLVFTWINWIKLPFFAAGGIINSGTALTSLKFFPLVPLGVWLGVWLNRNVSE